MVACGIAWFIMVVAIILISASTQLQIHLLYIYNEYFKVKLGIYIKVYIFYLCEVCCAQNY